jgi:hypothetical protein
VMFCEMTGAAPVPAWLLSRLSPSKPTLGQVQAPRQDMAGSRH